MDAPSISLYAIPISRGTRVSVTPEEIGVDSAQRINASHERVVSRPSFAAAVAREKAGV